jgi:hypothetical protein
VLDEASASLTAEDADLDDPPGLKALYFLPKVNVTRRRIVAG